MIKFRIDDFLNPLMYSTLDKNETGYRCGDELIYEIKQLQEQVKKQKEVIDKAIAYISKEFLCYDNESDEYICGLKAIDILNEVSK